MEANVIPRVWVGERKILTSKKLAYVSFWPYPLWAFGSKAKKLTKIDSLIYTPWSSRNPCIGMRQSNCLSLNTNTGTLVSVHTDLVPVLTWHAQKILKEASNRSKLLHYCSYCPLCYFSSSLLKCTHLHRTDDVVDIQDCFAHRRAENWVVWICLMDQHFVTNIFVNLYQERTDPISIMHQISGC